MDWTKAKNILIIALLVTNLMLLGVYALRAAQRNGDNDEETQRRILTEYNVFLETEIPRRPAPMAVLFVRPETEDAALIEKALSEQTPIPDDGLEALLNAANDLLERCGLMTENTKPAPPFETNGGTTVIRYRDVFDGIPIEESHILCAIEAGRIVRLSRKWYTPLELNDTKGEILGPIEALMRLLPEKDKDEPFVVKNMELVYRVSPERPVAEFPVGDTALPAWKITDNKGTVTYIAAYAQ
ncbi:MAG: hypothetical protein LBP30_04140 [Clostridiales Family XIII bacterium]|jgi:hypothetical protein|nr:hypothetical protein [Clostridiales Family XIII bacterium]